MKTTAEGEGARRGKGRIHGLGRWIVLALVLTAIGAAWVKHGTADQLIAPDGSRVSGPAITYGGGMSQDAQGHRLAGRILTPASGISKSLAGTVVNGAVLYLPDPRAGAQAWTRYR